MIKINFNPIIILYYFSKKVREACKSCKRYGKKATCPPYIESIEYYKELLPTYRKGMLVVKKFKIIDCSKWKELGKKSSLEILIYLKQERLKLLKKGKFPIIFSAGSCKFCSDNCSFPCKYPEESAIPIEGTGIDVITLVNDIAKIKITFPVKNYFYRIGVIFYD